jgi:hypothetical protein
MEAPTNIGKFKTFMPDHSNATIKTFFMIVECVLKLRTVSLYKCKDKMSGVSGKKTTQVDSHYKRLIRFFRIKCIDKFCEGIFAIIISLLGIDSNLLVLDRTNWKTGKKNINLLTLGVLFHNCFIPLCWQQLDKRGNSNFSERKTLMEKFIANWERIGKSIKGMVIVADREFIGPLWLNYLHNRGLFFVFRLKDNMYFELCEQIGKKTPIAKLCKTN